MINCAIIGCGKIAGSYDTPEGNLIRTHAKAYVNNKNCKIVGVTDVNEVIARNFAKIWKISNVFKDAKSLLDSEKVDLISICTPTETHKTFFDLACENKVRTIWLEKPAALSCSDVEHMLKVAKEKNIQVWVNYFRRFDVGFIKIKNELSNIGTIENVRAIYTKGLRHNGSHMIDLLHWYFGDLKEVKIEKVLNDKEYPAVSAKIIMNHAQINLVALNYQNFEMFELDIIGSKGRIRVIDGGQEIIFYNVVESKFYSGYKNLNIENTHNLSYGQIMAQGLAMGLSNQSMPGLMEELKIQNTLNQICSEARISL